MASSFNPFLSALQLSSISSSMTPGGYPSYSGTPPVMLTAGSFAIHNDIGEVVTTISTDGTLSGDSTTTIPTESAVKAYVDTASASVPVPLLLESAVSPYQLQISSTLGTDDVQIGCDGTGNFNVQTIGTAPQEVVTNMKINVSDATDSTSTSTGAVTIDGGLGVLKNLSLIHI